MPSKIDIDVLSVLVLSYKGIFITINEYKIDEELADEYIRVDSLIYKELDSLS